MFILDSYYEEKIINGVYYLIFDKRTTIEQLYNYILGDKIT